MSWRRPAAVLGLALLAAVVALTLTDNRYLLLLIALAVFGGGMAALEGWRLRRLLLWLRTPRLQAAPLVEGPWGDLAYRIERLLEGGERRLRAERQQREEFLAAIEASPNGVMLLDAQEQIAWLNAQAADHFGLHPQRDLRQRITNLVRQPAFVAYLQGGDYAQPLTLPLHDTRTLSLTLRRYGDGALLLLSQDISERERADAMRRDFVANASHEIRTPMAALAGFVETLRTLPLQPPERDRVLELMQQQSRRMQALVDDLLVLARLEGSPRPPADQWCLLADLLAAVRGEAEALSGGRHRLQWPERTPALELAGVEAELHSALANLLSNAIRYTPEGGSVSLRCEPTPDGGLLMAVSDTGPGIAAEHLPRLTERFYRVDGSRSRETGGTGLGLAIVKHIVQRHGGQLRIDSELGVGSSFTLEWPALRVREAGGSALGDEAAPAYR